MHTPFRFEDAPDLPGADRVARCGLGVLRQAVQRLWNVEVEGVENIPLNGAAIIAPNHLSFCDSVFVPAAIPRRVWAIGKGEYMDDWKTKHLFPAMGMIPVDRSGGDASKVALDTAARVLAGGHLFMIYPEGTRSRTTHLHKGRTGAARLAARTGAPIIPVGHQGTLAIQPPDQFRMKTGLSCTIRFGEPVNVSDFGDPSDPRLARTVTDVLMFRISELSGQSYVDTYAGRSLSPTTEAPQPRISVPKRPSPGPRPSPLNRATPAPSVDLRGPVITSTAPASDHPR